MKEKSPLAMIRDYYSRNGITHGSTVLFLYVRKKPGGGAVLEYWAARRGFRKNAKRGSAKEIVAKPVLRYWPETGRRTVAGCVVNYSTWSRIIPDHLLFEFCDELKNCRRYPVGERPSGFSAPRPWKGSVMPSSEIMLNGFGGTRYEWCSYLFKDEGFCAGNSRSFSYWGKNPYGSLPDYLRKFDLNPRAMEMFGKFGAVQLMKEKFLVRLRDDAEFAKWYKKHAREMLLSSPTAIQAAARKAIGKTEWLAGDIERRRREKLRRKRREAYERGMEAKRKREAEARERRERKSRSRRIRALYLRLKSVCRTFGAYEVVVPKSEREMLREGKAMHNCIGHMYPSRQGVDCVCFFLWKNGKPCVDVEVETKTFNVVQCRLTCNREAKPSQKKIAGKIADEIKGILKAS